MNLMTSVIMAFRNIRANKMRSFLTMLGIIIGVASVITLLAIGQGSSKSVANSVNSLGSNLITVSITNTDTHFTMNKMNQVNKVYGVKSTAPVLNGRETIANGSTSSSASAVGTTASYLAIRNMTVADGHFISNFDEKYRTQNVVLGSDIAETLFGSQSPVGKSVLINGNRFNVIGVLNSKGGSMGQNSDDTVYIPFTTAQRLLKTTYITQFYAEANNQNTINLAVNGISRLLSETYSSSDDYSVVNQQDILQAMSSIASTMTLLLAGIAGISLLVGGIGIMNIMLVSVTERTREIGIRKAIGAKNRDILLQFLIESIVLSMIGGLCGIAIGILGAQIYSLATKGVVVYSISVISFAFLFSLAVGVVFGVFPAFKASRMNPIEALRME